MKKEDGRIVLLLWEALGWVDATKYGTISNQNLMASKMVFVIFRYHFVLWNFVLQGIHAIQFTGLCIFSACIL